MKEKIDVQKPDDLGLDISDLRYFLVMLLFSAVVFFLLISQRLTNTFDGLWNNTWFFGGYWQVVTGRWLWPVIDALRFGIQTEPFNSLLTLSMSALAVTLLRKFFTEKDSVVTYLAGMAVLASTVTEIQLSYRFQSPVFGCSFLFSVLAGSHGPMALAGDRCAAVWHPDGTFQFIADTFHVGAGCYPASEVFYREGFCRDLSGGYGCSGQHGH